MRFFDSVFNAFLTREQRERVSQKQWSDQVAEAARQIELESEKIPRYLPPTPASSLPSSPKMGPLSVTTSGLTSFPMTPSLSSASSSSESGSPTRSRPPTAGYSTSPRPTVKRHASIAREPISYDCLITMAEKPRRSTSDAGTQLLYPLPPLVPMEGIGKHRRAIDASSEYLSNLERNTIEALRPFIDEDTSRISRFRRDTTTPPRAYSTSPQHIDLARRQRQMQCDLERLTAELEAAELEEQQTQHIQPPRTCSSGDLARRNARAPARGLRRAHTSRERVPRAVRRSTNGRPQPVSGLTRTLKQKGQQGYKHKPMPKEALSASLETLVDGEE
ncbi:hypothetical protein EX30DRAFT_225886 [Ascodesmis nigricans]|uniref:Uncharacterized protein n=1 Tax=Ascodesmis nigricans TaxID=341454 RepID=A0A4S2MJ61_9PEZI|nr:hypothetical protein EX30DRAFT_225886 [Ascodesmis nigricans]